MLLQELDASKEQLEKLLKRYDELEAKSKADIKVLIKEVKSLRSSQTELKQELSQTHKEKSEAEVVFFFNPLKCILHIKFLLNQVTLFT